MTTMTTHRSVIALFATALAACPAPEAHTDDATSTGSPAPDDGSGTSAAASSAGASTTDALGPDDGTVTYYRDVLPIFRTHCTSCHQADAIGPFVLDDYAEAWQWRDATAAAVSARTMPPWLPAPGCNTYANDLSLPDDALATIVAWVAEDGPRGDPADAPAPDPDAGPPELPRVDVELAGPEPYTPTGADDYRCFLLDWPYDTPTFVTGFDTRPGNPAIVHHVIAYRITADRVATYEDLDAADPEPGYTCFGGPGGDVTDPGAGLWLGAWAPGGGAAIYPEGTGLEMDPGSKVVLQIHYNTAAAPGTADDTSVALMVADTVEREAFMMLWADLEWLSGNMPIPAGSTDTVHTWELDPTLVMDFLTDVVPPDQPFLLHTAGHHMHKLGTRAHHTIERADGSTDCLLDIEHWDFDWQRVARFTTPMRFEPGDVLKLSCQWDNGAGTQEVNWGEGTADEMCLGIYYVTNP